MIKISCAGKKCTRISKHCDIIFLMWSCRLCQRSTANTRTIVPLLIISIIYHVQSYRLFIHNSISSISSHAMVLLLILFNNFHLSLYLELSFFKKSQQFLNCVLFIDSWLIFNLFRSITKPERCHCLWIVQYTRWNVYNECCQCVSSNRLLQ